HRHTFDLTTSSRTDENNISGSDMEIGTETGGVGRMTRLAVLIDADNAQASLATELLEEIARYGTATVKRAYGDWTTTDLKGWKAELHRHAIQPIQQFR